MDYYTNDFERFYMEVQRKLKRERNIYKLKIVLSFIFAVSLGYFVYKLILSGFFISWEIYFAAGCYVLILIFLFAVIFGVIRWMHYNIFIEDGRLKIRDGFFSKAVSIPIERIYYINSIRLKGNKDYDSLFITDKKTGHKKVRKLSEDEFSGKNEHLQAVQELKYLYPDRTFYYYRVQHHGFKFSYFFFMIYKNCERCKFSDTSMDLVKKCLH